MKYCDQCQSTYPSSFSTCPKDQAPLRPLAELGPGVRIRDKYEILDKIGTGGMATVYKAKHLTFNEICAIKVVSTKLLEDQDFLKRFKAEAIITRKLKHPNAVALSDFDVTDDGRPFIVMEYVQGRSLRSLIHDLGALPPPRAFNIAKQVASALGAAHKLGIVHRDIKPDNIIVVAPQPGSRAVSDIVKVFDFGIAKMRGGGADISVGASTQTGMVVGTPQYVSPEQASGKIGDQIDGRSDLYSLGIVLYEMLTSKLPFTSDTAVGYLIAHMQNPPTPPKALKPPVSVPDTVWAVLSKCLEKDRNQRYANAEELIAALDKPHTFAPTVVMGSDPGIAQSGVQRSGLSGGHSVARSGGAAVASAPALAAKAPGQSKAEGTVFGGDEPSSKRALGDKIGSKLPDLPWKKIGQIAAVVVLLFIAGVLYSQYRSSDNAVQQTASANQDATLRQEIEEQFRDNDSLRGQKIDVSVQNSVVTLTGIVNKAYLSEIAETLAKNLDGVSSVNNKIEVKEEQQQKEQVWQSRANTRAYGQQNPYIDQEVQQYIRRGYQLMAVRDFSGAQSAFQGALDLAPNNQIAQNGLHRAQLAQAGANLFHR